MTFDLPRTEKPVNARGKLRRLESFPNNLAKIRDVTFILKGDAISHDFREFFPVSPLLGADSPHNVSDSAPALPGPSAYAELNRGSKFFAKVMFTSKTSKRSLQLNTRPLLRTRSLDDLSHLESDDPSERELIASRSIACLRPHDTFIDDNKEGFRPLNHTRSRLIRSDSSIAFSYVDAETAANLAVRQHSIPGAVNSNCSEQAHLDIRAESFASSPQSERDQPRDSSSVPAQRTYSAKASSVTYPNRHKSVLMPVLASSIGLGTFAVAAVIVYSSSIRSAALQRAQLQRMKRLHDFKTINHGLLYNRPDNGGLIEE